MGLFTKVVCMNVFLVVGVVLVCTYFSTNNVLLILKIRDIIFLQANT
jgi:hypothetical protein